ncbi:hypothetical protein GEMRC1_009185 [Eukaryota sp. GEM-RC1]
MSSLHFSKAGRTIHAALHINSKNSPSSARGSSKTPSPFVSDTYIQRSRSHKDVTTPITPRKRMTQSQGSSSFLCSPRPSAERKSSGPEVGHYNPRHTLAEPSSPRFSILPRFDRPDLNRECQYSHNVPSHSTDSTSPPKTSPSASFLSPPRPSSELKSSRVFDGYYDYSDEPISPRTKGPLPFDRQMDRPQVDAKPLSSAPDAVYNPSLEVVSPRRDRFIPFNRQSPRRLHEKSKEIPMPYDVNYEPTQPRVLVPAFEQYSPRETKSQTFLDKIYDGADKGDQYVRKTPRSADLRRSSSRESIVRHSSSLEIPETNYDVERGERAIRKSNSRLIPLELQSPRDTNPTQKSHAPDKYYDYEVSSPRSPTRTSAFSKSPRFDVPSLKLMEFKYDPKYGAVSPRVKGPGLARQLSREDVYRKQKVPLLDVSYDLPPRHLDLPLLLLILS